MAAKQRLTKGRSKARQKKMFQIAQLLEIPGQLNDSQFPSSGSSSSSSVGGLSRPNSGRQPREHRPLFSTANRVPGVASALRRDSMPSGSVSRVQLNASRSIDGDSTGARRKSANPPVAAARRESSQPITVSAVKSRETSRNRSGGTPRSRESSPRVPRPRSEEIPLEDFRRSQNASPVSRNSSNAPSRSHTPSRLMLLEPVVGAVVANASGQHAGSGNGNGSTAISSKDATVPTVVTVNTSSTAITIPVELSPTSEETSFIANEERQKKRGGIETV